jgi:hypothetical protein
MEKSVEILLRCTAFKLSFGTKALPENVDGLWR